MNIRFVLVEPALPENIGACARALKTMGFSNLVLVNPGDPLDDRARWMAVGSIDILENALVHSNLKAAVQDCDLTIGTTVRKRSIKFKYYSIEEMVTYLKKRRHWLSNIAFVFGRENNGLTNAEIKSCDVISYIPIKANYPSLNLAQAVMVYAYSFSFFTLIKEMPKLVSADAATLDRVKSRVSELLVKIGVEPSAKIFDRIIKRVADIGFDDLKLLYYIVNKLESSHHAQSRREK